MEAEVTMHHGPDGTHHLGPGGSFWCPECEAQEAGAVSKTSSTAGIPARDEEPPRTRSGRILFDADVEALADEAERGYDVSNISSSEAPSVSSPPEAGEFVRTGGGMEFRKFHVAGRDRRNGEWTAPIEIRCWICGVAGVMRPDGPGRADAAGLEELTAWARGHECPGLTVNGGGCER